MTVPRAPSSQVLVEEDIGHEKCNGLPDIIDIDF